MPITTNGSDVQFANARAPMKLMFHGMPFGSDARLAQNANASEAIIERPAEKVTDAKTEQPEKAPSLIVSTAVLDMSTEASAVLSKAFAAIATNVVGKATDCRPPQ